MGAVDLPRRPLADKFLHRALVFVNVYKCTNFFLLNFNFLAQVISEIWSGSQNKNWELLISQDAP